MLCFSHVFWDPAAWQRNHHVMSKFSGKFPVVYCTPVSILDIARNSGKEIHAGIQKISENLTTVFPLVIPGENRIKLIRKLDTWILKSMMNKALQDMGAAGKRRVLWFYYPRWVYMAGRLKESLVIYDIQDEYLTQFNAPFDIESLEENLLDLSDIIFTGTKSLKRKKGKGRTNVKFVPCGVDFNHFHAVTEEAVSLAGEMQSIRKPVLGYVGWIGERVDMDLIYYLAEQRPDWSFVMVGPVDIEITRRLQNIHFLGKKKYEDLPSYIKGFDICLIPFKMDAVTMDLNPTKLLEYMAAKKPVISVGLYDVKELYTDMVEIADTKEAFLSLTDKTLRERDTKKIEKGCALALKMSWENTANEMLSTIAGMIGRNTIH